MDDQPVRVVNVDEECSFALMGFPNGVVDIKSKLSAEKLALTLRTLADHIETTGQTGRN
jgi:hypothetical protein